MEHNDATETRRTHGHRTPYERFVEATHDRVSQAPFFFVCLAVVLVWLASAPLWVDLKAWQVAIHTVASIVSLLLLVLLENAGRRSDEAAQEKLNVIAEALSDLMDSRAREDEELGESVRKLREAVGLEERH
ncbi:MAG: low affinity iron permease family protein [Nocardioides sp.]|nr:low affinity iron permease family protein [Nocardioides sp.]